MNFFKIMFVFFIGFFVSVSFSNAETLKIKSRYYESLSVNRCGKEDSKDVEYISLKKNGSFMAYSLEDGEQYNYKEGGYKKINSRFYKLYDYTQWKFLSYDWASGICDWDVVVNKATIVTEIKLNKNRTSAKLKASKNMKGYNSDYGRWDSMKYLYSGEGKVSVTP